MNRHALYQFAAQLDAVDAHAALTSAAHDGAFGSSTQDNPTQAQAVAGNYKLGRATVQGLRVAIEQPQGSIRRGVGPDGKEWASRMAAHYGYFVGTKGADGDGIDCFIGPFPESKTAFVINQNNKGGGFDEHKVMVGFMDEKHARAAYLNSYERGWSGLKSIVPLSISQLRWWLKHGKTRVALTSDQLPEDGNQTMNKVEWNREQPKGMTIDKVLYEARRLDGADGLLLDCVSMDEIMEDSDGVIALDALVVEYAQMGRTAERLRVIMDRSGGEVKAPAVQVSEPFKARGVTNIAAVYELSDGQTVSIFFHNPDTSPNKLTTGDELISWKWLLNKKDITIVVAPEKGQDLNPRTVAQRIMKLAEKNSAAFQKANAKRAERLGAIQESRDRIAEKEATLSEKLAQLEAVKFEKEQSDGKKRPNSEIQGTFNARSLEIGTILKADGWDFVDGQYEKGGVSIWGRGGADLAEPHYEYTIKGGNLEARVAVADDLSVSTDETASKVLEVANGAIVQEQTAAQRVDAAYQFANATDAFKERVAESIDETDYSEFASAKAMDLKAKELGAEIHWGLGATLDGVEDEDDFDPEAEFDACPVVDQDEDATLDGDFKGHPFRGNQYKKASAHSHAAVKASISAKHAEKDGDAKGAKTAHKSAHYSHMAAAESTSGKARRYHRKMAKFHGGKSGMALDSVVLDDAGDFTDSIVGKIMQGGELKGRAVIGGDGKAMVFVGDSDDQRVTFRSKGEGNPILTASWSDDDAPLMVEWLLNPVEASSESDDEAEFLKSAVQAVADHTMARLVTSKYFTFPYEGDEVIVTDEVRARVEAAIGEPLVEAVLEGLEGQVTLVPASKAKGEEKEPATPVEVYAFKDATPEALALFAIGAQNTATHSTYKTAVSVEKSADANGMSVRWEAVAALPTFDDATGGLFGDGDSGFIRGELTYNGTKLAMVYVREDGMAAFDYTEALKDGLSVGYFDPFEDDYSGWNDAWDEVISKLRDVCDGSSYAQRPAIEVFKEALEKKGWSDKGTGTYMKTEDGQIAIEMSEDANKWHRATLKVWIDDKWADMPDEVAEDAREYQDFAPNASDDEVAYELSKLLESADVLQAWADSNKPSGVAPSNEAVVQVDNDVTRLNAALKAAPKDRETVSSDDPQAIEKLEKKLAALQMRQEFMKKANRLIKKGDDAGLLAMGFTQATIEAFKKPDFAGRVGFPDYELSNNNGVISNTRKRLEDLQRRKASEATPQPEVPPVTPDPVSHANNAQDREFLMSVIDGTHPEILEPELAGKIEEAYQRNSADVEMVSLFSQAVNAYTQAMMTATAGV